MGNFGVGQSIRRVEDQRFLTGGGRYTDDISVPGQVYLYVLRSPHAHADIRGIDVAAAKTAPGVVRILVAADLAAIGTDFLPDGVLPPDKDRGKVKGPRRPVLAVDRVRYVGEPVAAIVAETLAQARDAAEMVEIDYSVRPVASSAIAAVAAGAPQLHPDQAPGNVLVHCQMGDLQATEAAFAQAARIVTIDLVNSRIAPTAMEPRGAIGEYDPKTDSYTLTQGNQGSHSMRDVLARAVLKVPPAQVRVISPDVGGGFGMKTFLFHEPVLCVVAAKLVGKPVKWIADRSESFLNDTHGRDQISHAALALDKDGHFLGLRVSSLGNVGAYLSLMGAAVQSMAGHPMMTGVYRIATAYADVKIVVTNTAPVDAYRGAGRPEASYLIERLVEKAARETGIPSSELRRRNFIRPEEFPYKTAFGKNFDSGRYAELMDKALQRGDAAGFPARRAEAKRRGKLRGLGISYYVEACAGFGTDQPRLSFDRDGRLTIHIGTQSNGQGHETVYAQIAADAFNIPIERISVRQGDTNDLPTGGGTGASRSIPVGGSAVKVSVVKMIEQGTAIAAELLETAPVDVTFVDGAFRVAGTDRTVSLQEVIVASFDDKQRPTAAAPGLLASEAFTPPDATFPNGCHVCEVEVDEATGETVILRYTIQDDLGLAMNPLLMAGQIYGGAVQGLGQALFEEAVYDSDGQLTTGSFNDYCMPRADNTPTFDFAYTEVPTPRNALGIKGAGEAGTVGATPAAVNAVLDALQPLGVTHLDMPLTPLKVWQAIHGAKTEAA
ncbi:MAG: xanthine dehydrogenase family protein molybdopterin-binding subunit [Rhodospirillaceae bacterium]|nr:MAG: xanthine dehydrogenase family protein molybdopterin-binding subunit [Rhodospirillaceae bacterium]